MSITLTEEQTKIFKKNKREMNIFVIILSTIIFIVALMLSRMNIVVAIGAIVMIAYLGAIVGVIIFLIAMPQIWYYQEEENTVG